MSSDIYLSDILLLCTSCKQPIKARINTSQWIRCEWIDPQGRCLKCHQQEKQHGTNDNDSSNTQLHPRQAG